MKVSILTNLLLLPLIAANDYGTTGKIQFSGVGYDSQYQPISEITDNSKECSCELGESRWFTGPNAPFSENLAVHIRGPLNLFKFGYYSSSRFVIGDNSSEDWNRLAYYDNSYGTDVTVMDNVTFLGHVGEQSDCLGNALSYINQDAQTPAKTNGAPGRYLQPLSNVEYMIFSNISCPKSNLKGGCGVYREGIPAFYGFGGQTKMFLFEFSMPNDVTRSNTTSYYDDPSIWLSSDTLPRVTDRYTEQTACSCLFQGCGAFEIFSSNSTTMQSSLITLQGIDENDTNSMASMFNNNVGNGYFARPVNTTVAGGIIFDSTGNVVTFLKTNSSFDTILKANEVNALLNSLPELGSIKTIAAGNETAPATSSKINAGHSIVPLNSLWYFGSTFLAAIAQTLLL